MALTLLSAFVHATWNTLLRSGMDRLRSITVMSLATTVLALPFALILPLPADASRGWLLLSVLLQVIYSVFLAYAYEYGELAQVYPLVRGTVPPLVSLGGLALAGQRLAGLTWLGIALVAAGIVSLNVGRARAAPRSILFALAAGLFVAGYVLADGIGVRLAGSPYAYVAWVFVLDGLLLPVAYVAIRRQPLRFATHRRETRRALAGGLLSFVSYGAIMTALAQGAIGPVAALRETSIVFSALLARFALGERVHGRRLLACAVVSVGAACIGYSR